MPNPAFDANRPSFVSPLSFSRPEPISPIQFAARAAPVNASVRHHRRAGNPIVHRCCIRRPPVRLRCFAPAVPSQSQRDLLAFPGCFSTLLITIRRNTDEWPYREQRRRHLTPANVPKGHGRAGLSSSPGGAATEARVTLRRKWAGRFRHPSMSTRSLHNQLRRGLQRKT
jgi:hypothetical protein